MYEFESSFPFTKDAKTALNTEGISIADLLTSSEYSLARARGLIRIKNALDSSKVSPVKLETKSENVLEILSYGYARIIVSALNDNYLTNKYALGESVKMGDALHTASKEHLIKILDELGIKHDSNLRIFFTDYVTYTCRINEPEWKLTNHEVKNGYVIVPIPKICRLIQNAIQDRINSELPIELDDGILSSISGDVNAIRGDLTLKKSTFCKEVATGPVDKDAIPPCISQIIKGAVEGINLPHNARFALVSFLSKLGVPREQICDMFKKSPDYDERTTAYQVGNICDRGYKCPECKTMRTNGLCIDDSFCKKRNVSHPMYAYEIKIKEKSLRK